MNCARCNKETPTSEFPTRASGAIKERICKQCASKKAKEYYLRHREKIKDRTKRYRLANRDKNRTWQKRYYNKNNEVIRQRQRSWRARNRERFTGYTRKWRHLHPAQAAMQSRICTTRRREVIKMSTPKWVNQDELNGIYRSRPKGYEVDHIYPLLGKTSCGLHVPWNLQFLTKSENSRKGNRIN